MKNIALLGATGSIGTQTLEVLDELNDFCLKSISVGKNIASAIKIIEKYCPKFVSVIEYQDMMKLKTLFPDINFGYGEEGLIQAATFIDRDDFLINAVVGMVGLKPTIAAIKKGINILLANKETLVVAGHIIKQLVKDNNVSLIPIDSEHSAIFQCISNSKTDVSKVIITASGGALRNYQREDLKKVTVKDALNHPNWHMGAKITIDSATMVNKGLEIIEAHYLFDLNYDNIETIIHPESIIHSMVEFVDSSIIAQLSTPNMKMPIQYALTYPKRCFNPSFKKLDFSDLKLTFNKMDYERFPLIKLAYKVGRMGGVMPAVYNKANEVAVNLFLNEKIKFLDIETIIIELVSLIPNIINPSLDEIIHVCDEVEKEILSKIS